jgi:hypothetical protein
MYLSNSFSFISLIENGFWFFRFGADGGTLRDVCELRGRGESDVGENDVGENDVGES